MVQQNLEHCVTEVQHDLLRSYHPNFMPMKKDLIDYIFKHLPIESFAELGCVYNIECDYTMYILEKYGPKKAFLVDTHWTETAKQRCAPHPAIQTIEGNFGDIAIAQKIGPVDAVILFDVLLHQVAPDWDRVLQIYGQYTSCFLLVNPQFVRSSISVRLLDLGPEEYPKHVPHSMSEEPYNNLFEKLYEYHPDHPRIWRDVHHIWQWGITNHDLIDTLDRMNFELVYLKNEGTLMHPSYQNVAFAFLKRG